MHLGAGSVAPTYADCLYHHICFNESIVGIESRVVFFTLSESTQKKTNRSVIHHPLINSQHLIIYNRLQ